MQDRVLRDRGMTISHHPLLVELRRLLLRKTSGNLTERFRRTRSFGERDGDRFGAQVFWGKKVDLALRHGVSSGKCGGLAL